MSKDRRLGRGLAALLGDALDDTTSTADTEAPAPDAPDQPAPADCDPGVEASPPAPASPPVPLSDPSTVPASSGPDDGLLHLSVYEIDDNPFQPRRDFREPEIASLAESLKQHDMLQPILVRRDGVRYQLISGERRLRAAILAGWSTVPARIREADDRLVAELAIVENLQRKDLNAIEKALSFKRYLDQHACTQEDLAGRLKIDRSTIANLMRLLELPETVREAIQSGRVSAGHARALLPLGDEPLQIDFCRRIERDGLSVRDTERLVQEKIAEDDRDLLQIGPGGRRRSARSQQLAALEEELKVALGAKVDLRQTSRGRGRMVIHFGSHEEFDRLRALLTGGGQHSPEVRAG